MHFHCLFWGLPQELGCKGRYVKWGRYIRFIHECEPGRQCERRTRDIQALWQRGFVDCRVTDGNAALAGYLSKYMQKSMHDARLVGRQAYSCSRNILRPVLAASSTLSNYLGEIIPVDNVPLQTFEFETRFLGRAIYQRHNIEIPHGNDCESAGE